MPQKVTANSQPREKVSNQSLYRPAFSSDHLSKTRTVLTALFIHQSIQSRSQRLPEGTLLLGDALHALRKQSHVGSLGTLKC